MQDQVYLRFQSDSDIQSLLNQAKRHEFYLDRFYFKMPRFGPTFLNVFGSLEIQALLTNLKLVIYTNDLPILLQHIKWLKNLKTLDLIRLPELPQSYQPSYYAKSQVIDGGNNALESIRLRCLISSKHFFCSNNQCTPSLIGFLKHSPNIKDLELISWPGKLVQIMESSKLNNTLEHLRIKGRTLGEDDLKRLTLLSFQKLVKLSILVDKNVRHETVQDLINSLPKQCKVKL